MRCLASSFLFCCSSLSLYCIISGNPPLTSHRSNFFPPFLEEGSLYVFPVWVLMNTSSERVKYIRELVSTGKTRLILELVSNNPPSTPLFSSLLETNKQTNIFLTKVGIFMEMEFKKLGGGVIFVKIVELHWHKSGSPIESYRLKNHSLKSYDFISSSLHIVLSDITARAIMTGSGSIFTHFIISHKFV